MLDVFDSIKTATAPGKIVIEAAGNGSMNLDHPIYENAFDRDFRDSGAIIVGGGKSSHPRTRMLDQLRQPCRRARMGRPCNEYWI
jgi:hypothetical protein